MRVSDIGKKTRSNTSKEKHEEGAAPASAPKQSNIAHSKGHFKA